jgi:hypothetical protein
MTSLHFCRGLSAVAVAATSLVLAGSQQSGASAEPCGTPGVFHVGGHTAPHEGIFGSRAKIERNEPTLCGVDSNSVVSAWSMVFARSEGGSGGVDLAQTGYIKAAPDAGYDFSGYHVFAQWTRDCNPNCSTGGQYMTVVDPAPTDWQFYTQYVSDSDNHIHMLIGGNKIAETGYNPANEWQSEWRASFSAESKHRQSQIPGSSANKVRFEFVQRYESNGNINYVQEFADQGVCGAFVAGEGSCENYHYDRYNPDSGVIAFKVWDER